MSKFKGISEYRNKKNSKYTLIPFNFHRVESEKYRAVNIGGEYIEFDKKYYRLELHHV